jgi:Cu/Ag efflux protein CusF
MRRTLLVPVFLLISALAGGAVLAAERIKATPCFATAPADLSPGRLAALAPSVEYPLAAGRVLAVDAKAGTITVAHAPIAHYYLQAETRIFRVQDPSQLTGLTAGDKIRFDLERHGKGFVVTRIENSL